MTRLPSLSDDDSLGARACVLIAALAGVLIFVAALAWGRDNPLPTYWDEANYFGDAASDYWAIRDHRPFAQRVVTLLKTDVGQPPAHRGVLALTLFFGPSSAVLRFTSLACFLLTLMFVYGAGNRVGGRAAGALAALTVLASPIVLASSIRFGTEYTLLLAEAATLYFLLSSLRRTEESRRDVVGLALALGLGLWSKPSFVLVAMPALVVTFAFSYGKICGPPYRWLKRSCLLGGSLGAVYLVPFSLKTLDYINRSVNKMGGRHSLGAASPTTFVKYFAVVVSTVTGPVVAGLLMLTALGVAALYIRQRSLAPADTAQTAAVAICCAGSAFLPVSHFFSGDHDMRYLAGDVPPLALALGIALSRAVLGRFPLLAAAAALTIFAQISAMLIPLVRQTAQQRFLNFQREAVVSNLGNSADIVFAPQEQWDWERLRTMCGIAMLRNPKIAYVGSGEPFNEKQINYAWIRRDQPVHVIHLWYYTLGAIDWRRTMRLAADSDVVLTLPGDYRGLAADKQPLDNANNGAFEERMKHDPHFGPPLLLRFGRFESTTVLVSINKRTGSQCARKSTSVNE